MVAPSVTALVTPSIHHQKNKDKEAENQEQNRPRLALPKDLKVCGHFVKVHPDVNLHQHEQKQRPFAG